MILAFTGLTNPAASNPVLTASIRLLIFKSSFLNINFGISLTKTNSQMLISIKVFSGLTVNVNE